MTGIYGPLDCDIIASGPQPTKGNQYGYDSINQSSDKALGSPENE
jgi:hypothetical protein